MTSTVLRPEPRAADPSAALRPSVLNLLWLVPLLLAHLPLLVYATTQIWPDEAYQFFPIAWGAVGILLYVRLREATPAAPRPGLAALFLLSGAFILLAGTAFWAWILAIASLILCGAGVALQLGGGAYLRAATPGMVLLLVSVPPPLGLERKILLAMQHFAVIVSSRVLDSMGVLHVVNGNLLELPERQLFVEEACSGLNSAVSSIAFAVACGFFLRRKALHVIVLAGLGLVFALACNIVRITSAAVLQEWWKIDIVHGWAHTLAGLLIFSVCVGFVLSLDRLLHVLLAPIAPRPVPVPPAMRPAFAVGGWLKTIAVAQLAVTLAGAVLIMPRVTWRWPTSVASTCSMPENARFALAPKAGPWSRVDQGQSLAPEIRGKRSVTWLYAGNNLMATVALDYAFPGYHDLTTCYQQQGWNIAARVVYRDAVAPAEEVQLKRSGAGVLLLFSLYDEKQRWLTWREHRSLRERIVSRLAFSDRPEADPQPAYQIQMLVPTTDELTPEQLASIRELYQQVRYDVAEQIRNQLPRKR